VSESPLMRHKPLLFCDIDGVLSLWGWRANSRPEGVYAAIDGVPHFLSTLGAEHLLALSAEFDLVWCTGWEEKADEYLPRLLGVPRGLPHLSFDGRTRAEVSARAHWKLGAIDEYAGDRPLAWIDDAFDASCHEWARARPAPTLLVATEPAVGLAAEHADALRAFSASLTAAA
jgi:HAD domain in Swiss Army Knife RNA repair proteins